MPPSADFRSKQIGVCASALGVKMLLLTWLSAMKQSSTVSGSDYILEETSGSNNETASTSTYANNVSSTSTLNCHGDASATEKRTKNFTFYQLQ